MSDKLEAISIQKLRAPNTSIGRSEFYLKVIKSLDGENIKTELYEEGVHLNLMIAIVRYYRKEHEIG